MRYRFASRSARRLALLGLLLLPACLAQPSSFAPALMDLKIPVAGVRPGQLRDSFDAPRSGGRRHRAIDIMAPRGTPVVAAADGVILRLRSGSLGGITLYQRAADRRTILYYAHLERYAAGVRPGLPVRRGETIAYVGDTGNAGPGNYHLHFGVSVVDDPNRYWGGRDVNPYPLLQRAR